MPQLNPEFFLSQVFWLVITFSFLFIFLWKISLPRISTVLKKREKKINDDIEAAKNLQTEAEIIHNKINDQILNVREETSDLIKEKIKQFQNNISTKLEKTDSELKKNISNSFEIIEKNKQDVLKTVNIQIQEIVRLTLRKLTGAEIKDEEIITTIKINKEKTIN